MAEIGSTPGYTAPEGAQFTKKEEKLLDAYAQKDAALQTILDSGTVDPLKLIEAQDLQGEKSLFMQAATSMIKGEKDIDDGINRNIP